MTNPAKAMGATFWQGARNQLHILLECHFAPFSLPDLLLSFWIPDLCSLPGAMLCFLPVLLFSSPV